MCSGSPVYIPPLHTHFPFVIIIIKVSGLYNILDSFEQLKLCLLFCFFQAAQL